MTNSDDEGNMTSPAKSSDEWADEPMTEEQEESRAEKLASEGERLLTKIERTVARTWDDYMKLAGILGEISRLAMRLSGANSRSGRAYSECMSRLLARRAPKLGDGKHERMRAALLNIHENRADLDLWRASWTESQRQSWLSPITVWDRFNARKKQAERERGRAVGKTARTDKIVELADGLDRKDRELRRLRDNPFIDMDIHEIAALIRKELGADLPTLIDLLSEPDPEPEADIWPVVAKPEPQQGDEADC